MSSTWYPAGWIIDVPNPGYGELELVAPAHPHEGRPLVVEDWSATLAGPQIGPWLSALTDRALQPDTAPADADSVLPGFVTPAAARVLLPALQRAVVLATAGTDVYDRTWHDEADSPAEPYCARCGQGTLFTPGAMPNAYCDRYGHQPYGWGADTRWETAQRIHGHQMSRWESRQTARVWGDR